MTTLTRESVLAEIAAHRAAGSRPDFTNRDFSGLDLHDADFTLTSVAGATFTGTNLTGANFSHSMADNTDFTGAELGNANFDGARIAGATYEPGQLLHVRGLDPAYEDAGIPADVWDEILPEHLWTRRSCEHLLSDWQETMKSAIDMAEVLFTEQP